MEGGKDERRKRKEGKTGREKDRIEARRDSSSYHISIWVRKRKNHKLEVVQKSGYLWQHNMELSNQNHTERGRGPTVPTF